MGPGRWRVQSDAVEKDFREPEPSSVGISLDRVGTSDLPGSESRAPVLSWPDGRGEGTGSD